MQIALYVLVGAVAGVYGGFFGMGGGVILVPAMVFLFGLTQHQANGTALAIMIPPIGLLAAWRYYISGNVKLDMAVFMCIGFLFGGYLGAVLANHMPEILLRRSFGVLLLFLSFRMLLGK